MSRTVDLPAAVGSQAYFGFSAGTGAGFNSHDIENWELTVSQPREGSPVMLSAAPIDPAGSNDTLRYAWTILARGASEGDTPGGGADSLACASGLCVFDTGSGIDLTEFRFTPDDDGDYLAPLTVSDEDGGSSTIEQPISVANVWPTLTFTGETSITEGGLYNLSLSSSDPGADTIERWMINWGDGTIETVAGNSPFATHIYADGPNHYEIQATASDEDGTFAAVENFAARFDDNYLGDWGARSLGTAGTASATDCPVSFAGPASGFTYASISRPVAGAGDFVVSADFMQLGPDGVPWRMGIGLDFGTSRIEIHDSDNEPFWVVSGPAGVIFADDAGDTAGRENQIETIRVARAGSVFTFSVVQDGVETIITRQAFDVGALQSIELSASSHDPGAPLATTVGDVRVISPGAVVT